MTTKEYVLSLLEGSRGRSVSGKQIAESLSISRSAVWKAVKELQKEGYKIEAATNKGYSLSSDSDILSAQGMLPYLLSPAMYDKIFVHDILESTNKTAKEMAVFGAEHGTAVIAGSQSAGRGRFNRSFFSESDAGIYMSLVLRPSEVKLSSPTLVTVFAAVAVCEAIEAVSDLRPSIKWVNDIFLNGRKIAGILSEAVTDFESGSVQWIVVGIGINFAVPETDFPDDIKGIAGSLFAEGGAPVGRNRLCAEIINRITGGEICDESELIGKYRDRLFMLGREITVIQGGEAYSATAVDINSSGRLVVKKPDGEIVTLSSGEISVRVK